MKRLVALVAAVTVLVAASFSFTSCEKITKPKHLAGTTWTGVSDLGWSYNIIFTSESSVTCTFTDYCDDYFNGTGTYTFTNPSIMITVMEYGRGYSQTLTGTVNGSVMTLSHEGEFNVILTKVGK